MLQDEQEQAAWQAQIARLEERKKMDALDVVNVATCSLTLHSLLSMAAHGLKNNFLDAEQKTKLFSELKETLHNPELFNQIIEQFGANQYTQAVFDQKTISPKEFTKICALIDQNNAPWLNAIEENYIGGVNGALITMSLLAGVAVAAAIKAKHNTRIDDKIAEAELMLEKPKERPSTHITTTMTDLRSTIENLDNNAPTSHDNHCFAWHIVL